MSLRSQPTGAVTKMPVTDVGDGWYLGEVYMEDFVYEKEGVTTAGALRVRILGNAIIDCMSFDPDANIGAAE